MLDITIEYFYAPDLYYDKEEFDSFFERELKQLEKFSLWYSNLEDAGIREIFVAWYSGQIVGFLTTNKGGQAVAIEVIPELQNKGIALKLLDDAKCYYPERNESPEFWQKISLMREIMGYYKLNSLQEVKKYILVYHVG